MQIQGNGVLCELFKLYSKGQFNSRVEGECRQSEACR
jgi:hypothetical protein